MKLLSDAVDINELWEADKENKREECKDLSSAAHENTKSVVMSESPQHRRSKQVSGMKNTFTNLKVRMSAPTLFSKRYGGGKQSADQKACASETVKTDASFVEKKRKGVGRSSTVDVNMGRSKKLTSGAPVTKPVLQRGKSDAYLSRNARKDVEHRSDMKCRTELAIPGEYLFCSEVERSNSLATVYNQIRRGGNLRRSQSTGNLGKQTKSHKPKDEVRPSKAKEAPSFATDKLNSCSNSQSMRTTCEKLYTHKRDTENRKQDADLLANELQSLLDCNRNELTSKRTSPPPGRHRRQRELPSTENAGNIKCNTRRSINICRTPWSNMSRNKVDVTALTVSEQVETKPRSSSTTRRSQSCKSVQRRFTNLFNIKYLKGRNTQRSKSFATIREFSNADVRRPKVSSRRTRNDEGVSYYEPEYLDSDEHRGGERSVYANEEDAPIVTSRNFDINHTDVHGNSCLHHASSKGDISTIKYLLAQGGDVWQKNDEHSLPIDLAQNFQTAKLLSSATLFYSEQNDLRKEKNISQSPKLNTAL